MHRTHLRLGAGLAATALTLVAAAPAGAAVVSRSGANAITLSVAGDDQGSGVVTATYDGSETRTGETQPPVSVLKGQSVLDAGVLSQQAAARPGGSAACAGIAGNGGSVAQVGDSDCLSPGNPVQATLGSLDLSKLVVADPRSALAPLDRATDPVLENLQPLVEAIDGGLQQARDRFGDLGLVAGLGVVEGRCTASDGQTTGFANIADTSIRLQAPGQDVTLLDVPADPPPNTHVATDLSRVLTTVLSAVRTDVTTSLQGVLDPLTQITDQLQEQVVDRVVTQVEGNLAPLEENVLDITLNQQVHPAPGAIKVRAFDLELLPVVEERLGSPLVDLQIGNAACGPSDAVSAPQAAAPPQQQAKPSVPRAVSAGLATLPAAGGATGDGGLETSTLALLALAALGVTGLGLTSYRRLRG